MARDPRTNLVGYIQASAPDGTYTVTLALAEGQPIPNVPCSFPFRLRVGQQVYISRVADRPWDLVITAPASSTAQLAQAAISTIVVIRPDFSVVEGAEVRVTTLGGRQIFFGFTNREGVVATNVPEGLFVIVVRRRAATTRLRTVFPQQLIVINLEEAIGCLAPCGSASGANTAKTVKALIGAGTDVSM